MNFLKFNLIPIILIGCPALVFAQEELSLASAIETSLSNNYDIQVQDQRLFQADFNNSFGQAGLWPTVELSVSGAYNRNNNLQTASPFQLQGVLKSINANPDLTVNWNINGYRVFIEKSRLELLESESRGNADIVVSNTIQGVILSYYSAVLEKEKLREFERQLQLSLDKYEYTKVKTELGSAVSSDILLEETNYLTDSTNLINQSLQYRQALRSLNFIMAVDDVNKEYILTDSLQTSLPEYELEQLMDKVESGNVDLQKQYITKRIRGVESDLARSDFYPTLSVSAGYNQNYSSVDLSNAFRIGEGGEQISVATEPRNSISANTFANLRISIGLFNGGRMSRSIQNTLIEEDIEQINTEKLKNSLYRDIAQAHDNYQIRKSILAINQRKLDVAQRNLNLAEERYKSGTISSFDFRTVQNNQLVAAIQYYSSLYSTIDAQLNIQRLTGGILDGYDK